MNIKYIEREKVQAYVNEQIPNKSVKKFLNSCIGVLFVVDFAIFVATQAAMISIFILSVTTVVMTIWITSLQKNIQDQKEEIIFMMGIMYCYVSLSFLVFIYMAAATVAAVPLIYVILGILLYIIMYININIRIIDKIREGYYCSKKIKAKKVDAVSPAAGIGFTGIITRVVLPSVGQNGTVLVLCMLALAISMACLYRTHYLLKYYFIKTLHIYVESEWIE